MTLDIKINVSTGRKTIVTDQGDELDVVQLIAAVAEHDFTLVMRGVAERFSLNMYSPQGALLS